MRRLVARTAAVPFSIGFDRGSRAGLFTTADGVHAVIATGTFDLVEAPPELRRRQVDLFEDLLSSLVLPAQLLVVSRRADLRDVADRRLRQHLAARPMEDGGLSRSVFMIVSQLRGPRESIGNLVDLVSRCRDEPVSAPPPADAGRLMHQVESLVAALRGLRLSAEALTGHRLDRFLDERLPRIITVPNTTAPWREVPGWLDIDGDLTRTYFLDEFPGADLEAGWLGPLLDLRMEYDLAVHFTPVPFSAVLRLLNGRIRDLTATRMVDSGVGDPLVDAGLPEAMGLRRAVAANEQRALAMAVYLTVRGHAHTELLVAGRRAEEAAARSLGHLLPATLQMAPGRVATLPLGSDSLGRGRIVPSAAAATFFPWLWDDLRQPNGHLVGYDGRSGSPILIDTFDDRRFSNANIGIFGHSGAGKTHLMKVLLRADAAAGIGAFVIDPEAEYRGLCEEVGGEWVDLALGAGNSINVMDPGLAEAGERDPIGDQVSDLLDLIHTMCGQLLEDERAEVHDVLGELLAGGGATLGDVRALLESRSLAPRVARLLRRWTQGPLGRMFSAHTTVRIEADFVVFGLRDVKEEFLPVSYFLIAQWIWSRVRAQPRPRRLLFDEVGLLFEHPPIRRFLVRLARRVRKYQGSLCLVTQNAGDLLGSDQGLVLATNPSTLFLGAQREAEAARMQRAYGLTDDQVRFMASARRGQFLLIAGDSRHRIQVAAPPWQPIT